MFLVDLQSVYLQRQINDFLKIYLNSQNILEKCKLFPKNVQDPRKLWKLDRQKYLCVFSGKARNCSCPFVSAGQLAISALNISEYAKLHTCSLTCLNKFKHMFTNMSTKMFTHIYTHIYICLVTF
jgi:hypothetical protein